MSNTSELDLDLENLFQPAWAQGKTETNRFEKFTGNEGVKPERRGGDRPGGRGPRRDGGGGGGFGGGGFGGGQGGGRPGGPGGPGGPRGQGGPRRDAGGRGGDRGDRRGGFGRGAERPEMERREPLAPLPEFNVAFLPEDKGVEQLARQIRMTGRAYPLFQIALLILDKAERYHVQLTAKKKGDGTGEQLFVCALDESPWTSVEEAVAHVLKHHFGTFYQAERTPTDPPKGTYTFVAQCGMSGVILGPPNYHDYQNQLHKLHAEKFSRMPFDMFKARVKIVKDEAVVKKWIEEQSFKTVYHCLNVPEPLDLASLEEVGQHFSATHRDTIIKPVATLTLTGVASRALRCSGLNRLVLREWEQQRHFPLPIATKLSQQFANHGLQFFKVNKTVTHVSVARPQYLDIETLPVSENIKRIVGFINTTAKCTRKKLFEALAPTPKVTLIPVPAPVAEPAPAPAPAPVAEGAEAATAAPAEAPSAPAKPAEPEPTPEQTALSGDLHWLIHQGHVLEFGDGRLETAKKPAPRPVKAEKAKPAEAAAPETVTPETTTGTTAETVTSTESVTIPAETTAETPAVAPVAEAAPAPVAEAAPVPEPVVTPAAPVTEATPTPEAPSQA